MKHRFHLGLIAINCTIFCSAALAQEEEPVDGWIDDLNPFNCISVPEFAEGADIVSSGRESGYLCEREPEEEFVEASEDVPELDSIEERRAVLAAGNQIAEDSGFFGQNLSDDESLEEDEPEELGGISFDDLWSPAPTIPADDPLPQDAEANNDSAAPFDFDAQMAASRGAATPDPASLSRSGPVEIGDIYGARAQIALDATKQELFSKSQRVASLCQCVFSRNQCYQSQPYQYEELNTAVGQTESNLESQRGGVCNGWLANLRGKTSDNQGILDGYLSDTDIVLRNLETLDSSYLAMLADLDQQEVAISNEIRRQEQARQQAIAAQQQSSGSSGWNVLGQVLQQAGLQAGDIYAEVGGAFIQDVTSGGSGTALMETRQRYDTSTSSLEIPNYGNNDAGSSAIIDNVLVYGDPSTQGTSEAYGATNPSVGGAASTAGSYGILIYGVNGNLGSLIVNSRSSTAQAEADAFNSCGALCNGPILHQYFGPGQCVALVRGGRSMAEAALYLQTRTSLSAATQAAGQDCASAREASGYGGAFTCTLLDSACN
ncbi:MAG: hypothetical protein HOL48_00185 [Porticoccaceae bacterium]|mgnify:CR=1 FL=1|jgi:hypothetical protein|nr:hypothetical protein [Porticoccaceae bacterium]